MKKVEQLGIEDQTKQDGKVTYELYGDDMFAIILDNESRKYFITVGKYALSNPIYESIEDAKKYIDSKPWELIAKIGMVFIDELKKEVNKEN